MATQWSARAFGLMVQGDFPAPGLDGQTDRPGDRRVRVTVADARQVDRQWPGAGEVLSERSTSAGVLVMRVDRAAGGEYRIAAPGFGTFLVAGDGREIVVAPADPSPWRWQRYLIGQALPLAAVLQGLEVLHASAVVVDGRAVAFAGASFAGKTTLAMALVGSGADLLCDDVLALERTDEGLLAHPGPAVVNVRHGSAAALALDSGALLELGRDDEALRIGVQATGNAAPLAALYILDRGGAEERTQFEEPAAGEAALLLASSFNFIVTDDDRLRRQLDVCARLASCADIAVVRIPTAVTPDTLARLVAERLTGVLSCAA